MDSGIRRFLVVCHGCGRQYDASEIPAGTRFRCYCGETVPVPRLRAKEATVVRCTSCGAARAAGAATCSHCGADFTLLDRDLNTICPECMSRIGDRARFCPNCGTRIRPQGDAGRPTSHPCPACGDAARLRHRELGEAKLAVLECTRCGGLWVSAPALDTIVERARQAVSRDPEPARHEREALPRQTGPLYRHCPICEAMMSRVNYGRRSGVIVDRCPPHGVWFDNRELEATLRWIRDGGEVRAARAQREEARAAAVRERFRPEITSPLPEDAGDADAPLLTLIGSLFG